MFGGALRHGSDRKQGTHVNGHVNEGTMAEA